MIPLNFKVGPEEIEEFDLTDDNLRKVRATREGESEGFWVWFSPEDLIKYDTDCSEGIAIVVAANQTFMGINWGTYFPVEFRGEERPFCDFDNFIDLNSPPIKCEAAFKK